MKTMLVILLCSFSSPIILEKKLCMNKIYACVAVKLKTFGNLLVTHIKLCTFSKFFLLISVKAYNILLRLHLCDLNHEARYHFWEIFAFARKELAK